MKPLRKNAVRTYWAADSEEQGWCGHKHRTYPHALTCAEKTGRSVFLRSLGSDGEVVCNVDTSTSLGALRAPILNPNKSSHGEGGNES